MSADTGLAAAPGLQSQEVAGRLAELWAEQLKVPAASLDVERHFVDMGGYSLLVIVLLEAINREFGVEIALDAMVEHPSIAALARHICAEAQGQAASGGVLAAARGPGSAREFLKRDHGKRFQPFDAPELLQAYWIGEQDVFEHGGPAFFYEEYAVAELDVKRLDRALNKLIARHPGLRTIVLPDGRQQVVEFPSRFACVHKDLRGQGKAAFNDALTASRDQLQRHPLDSGVFPLFSFTVLEGDEGFVVQVVGRLLVFDGVSWQIFASELQRLYESDNTVLAPLELTVRDYTLAIEAFRQKSDAYARSADYWRQRVASLPEAPLLPRKPRSRDTVRTPTLTRRIFTLDATRWSKLKAIMEERKLTPTALVCATFCSVIGAWAKLPQFTINVMYGNRQPIHPDVDRVIGNFSTTLLLQIDNAEASTLFERAERVQKTMFRDLSHGTVSGVAVIRELNRHSAGSTVPKMPVVFSSFLGGVRDDREFFFMDKLGWKRLRGRINTPQVEFDHQVYVKNGELVLNWDVDESVYSAAMVEDMFAEYSRALVQLSEDPALGQNAQLSLVPPAQLLNRLAANNTDGPAGAPLLHAPFVRLAAEQGERTAVIAADRTLSYRELGATAAGIAAAIRQRRELPAGELVAVFLDKGWMEIAAVMGTLFAGGAYLPLAASTPVERLKYILQQAGVRVVLTAAAKRAQLPAIDGLAVIAVDEVTPLAEGAGENALGQAPSDLAYVIYTSGSTGNPKGVAITHEAAANTIADINERFGAGPDDRCIAISALTFDLSVYDIFGMLSAGAAIVVPRQEDIKSPEALAGLVAAHGVSIWNTVPAFSEMLVEHIELHGQKLPSLRVVMASGDWVPVSLPERVTAATGGKAQFISLGGATEASIWSNYYRVEGPSRHLPSIPYGYPLRNQRMYVLDHGHAFRPDWVPGEIYIAGVGLAQGYYKDEERTRASFVQSRRDGERLYRTGDWGRYLPSGAIEFLGRDDLQIKVRGYRIEIGEIESALSRFPGVQDAAVVPVRQDKNVSHLVAFVTAVPGQAAPDTGALRDFLGRHLPEYMIPSQIQCLAQLPRTDNAKTDRKALAQLAAEGAENAGGAEQPGTMAEVRLAAIWRELLQLPSVALNDNFFAVGGHSLLAVRLMGRIDVAFGKKLPLSALYADGTIKKLAARISGGADETFDSLVVINKGGARPPLFCIHPVGGNVLCYAKLAGALDPQQPVYGLQSVGLGDAAAAHTDVGAMAAHYLRSIAALAPQGPVHLLGWSMGGVVGYEMASQLAAAGRDSRLLMIDSWFSKGGPAPDGEALMSDFMRDLTGTQASFEAPGAQAAQQGADAELAQGPLYQVFLRNSEALQAYRPAPPSERMAITQVRAAELPEPSFPSLVPFVISDGQALRGPDAAPVVLPGDHYSIFRDDNVGALVAEVKKFLVQKDMR